MRDKLKKMIPYIFSAAALGAGATSAQAEFVVPDINPEKTISYPAREYVDFNEQKEIEETAFLEEIKGVLLQKETELAATLEMTVDQLRSHFIQKASVNTKDLLGNSTYQKLLTIHNMYVILNIDVYSETSLESPLDPIFTEIRPTYITNAQELKEYISLVLMSREFGTIVAGMKGMWYENTYYIYEAKNSQIELVRVVFDWLSRKYNWFYQEALQNEKSGDILSVEGEIDALLGLLSYSDSARSYNDLFTQGNADASRDQFRLRIENLMTVDQSGTKTMDMMQDALSYFLSAEHLSSLPHPTPVNQLIPDEIWTYVPGHPQYERYAAMTKGSDPEFGAGVLFAQSYGNEGESEIFVIHSSDHDSAPTHRSERLRQLREDYGLPQELGYYRELQQNRSSSREYLHLLQTDQPIPEKYHSMEQVVLISALSEITPAQLQASLKSMSSGEDDEALRELIETMNDTHGGEDFTRLSLYARMLLIFSQANPQLGITHPVLMSEEHVQEHGRFDVRKELLGKGYLEEEVVYCTAPVIQLTDMETYAALENGLVNGQVFRRATHMTEEVEDIFMKYGGYAIDYVAGEPIIDIYISLQGDSWKKYTISENGISDSISVDFANISEDAFLIPNTNAIENALFPVQRVMSNRPTFGATSVFRID